jgi:hypothetical protein
MADKDGSFKKNITNNLFKLLLEFELAYFLAPVLSDNQKTKLKERLLELADRF